jgi:hypothetical protein
VNWLCAGQALFTKLERLANAFCYNKSGPQALKLSMKPVPETKTLRTALLFFFLAAFHPLYAQMVTGVWHGKVARTNTEVKIIQNGDSLTGTSYYYISPNNYRRYTIRGYFDEMNNSLVWWDDVLLEEKKGLMGSPGKVPLLAVADFNCPGGDEMYLNGHAGPVGERERTTGTVDLTKVEGAVFPDEWDYVIANYTRGANDPLLIDSIKGVATAPRREVSRPAVVVAPIASTTPPAVAARPQTAVAKTPETIQENFIARKKIFTKEIPVTGKTIELRFYDHAQVDGDSISLFLDGTLIFQHIRLSEQAFVVHLPVADLKSTSELIMVAENLGSIPPNTSYMVALVGDKRYEAKLSSSENSSALIKLTKQ